MLLRKKPQLEFQCMVPYIKEYMPIIPAREFKAKWAKKARESYASDLKNNPDMFHQGTAHVVRCPGINLMMETGWIIRSWQDITISTNGDGVSFDAGFPVDQSAFEGGKALMQALGSHPEQQFAIHHDVWYDGTLRSIVKFNMPWVAKIPKGYRLLQLPIPYPDDKRFEATIGIHTRDALDPPLNIQLLWKVTKGREIIRAGTPLAQFVLIPEESHEALITLGDVKDWSAKRFVLRSRFVPDYNEIKRFARRLRGEHEPN